MNSTHPNLKVEVFRGLFVESRHEVVACIVDIQGNLLEGFGNFKAPIFARSAIKPIQCLPFLESGAADHFQVTDEEVALACASHSGQPLQVEKVQKWLYRMGLNEAQLECGAHPPSHENSYLEMYKNSQPFTALHNNCSGKHTGMLATALHLGENPAGYSKHSHPVQQRIKLCTEDYCQVLFSDRDFAIDGCTLPTFQIPLLALAKGLARFSGAVQGTAPHRILQSMVANPDLVSGPGRYTSEKMKACPNRLMIKSGAEGIMVAVHLEQKWCIACKVLDGSARAAQATMSYLLERMMVLDPESQLLWNWNKIEVGRIVAS